MRIQVGAPCGIDAETALARMQLGADASERDQVLRGELEDPEPFLLLYEDEQSRHRLVSREGPGRSAFVALPDRDEGARLRRCDPGGADSPLLLPDACNPRFVVAVLFFNLDDRLCIGRSRRKIDEAFECVEIHSQTVIAQESGPETCPVDDPLPDTT